MRRMMIVMIRLAISLVLGLVWTEESLAQSIPDGSKTRPLRVLLVPADGGTEEGTKADFLPIFNAVSRLTDLHFDVRVGQSYGAVVEGMANRLADIAFFGPVTFMQAKERGGAELLAVAVEKGQLDQVGLSEPHLAQRASELSGGQQQRVGIARAFMLDPLVVLADEPVASLDPHTSREILALLKRASKERGTTVLCSLHQVDLTREFADRVVGMHAGQIVFDGAPHDFNEAILGLIYGQTSKPAAAWQPALSGAVVSDGSQ